ncbi:MAG: histidine--tRNA ligase [archaeon]
MTDLQTVRGMRDLVGEDAMIQEMIEATLREVFVSYGYLPLYTPAVESFELFKIKGAAGEAIKDEIYYFKDKGERELALRFEFTASLARVAATTQLKMPFKRYQIGEVYRYDRPQAKRYRAFCQADIDILGVKGLEAETEVMMIVRDAFTALNLKPKVIFNSRKLLNDILGKYAKGKEVEAMRILDKMDKVEEKDIKAMLEEKGIDSKVLEVIKTNSLTEIAKVIGAESEGYKEVLAFEKLCSERDLDFVEFDSRLARGFEYYTGIVFEVKLDNGPSVGGGGRFDKLISLYGGQDTPAVGIGLGVSRIFDYLKESGAKMKMDGLLICGIGVGSKELFGVSENLRANGVFNEIDLVGKPISKNIEYAQKKGYKFVGIIGENELKANSITIKDLESGKQETVSLSDAKKIKEMVV